MKTIGFADKENGNFFGIEEDRLFEKLFIFIAFSLFCFLFLINSFFGLYPKESSLKLLTWSFFHILLSNNCSLKVGSELSFDILDSI